MQSNSLILCVDKTTLDGAFVAGIQNVNANSYLVNEIVVRFGQWANDQPTPDQPENFVNSQLAIGQTAWVTFKQADTALKPVLLAQRAQTPLVQTTEQTDDKGVSATQQDDETGVEYFAVLPAAVLQNAGEWKFGLQVSYVSQVAEEGSEDIDDYTFSGTKTSADYTFIVNNSVVMADGQQTIATNLTVQTMWAQTQDALTEAKASAMGAGEEARAAEQSASQAVSFANQASNSADKAVSFAQQAGRQAINAETSAQSAAASAEQASDFVSEMRAALIALEEGVYDAQDSARQAQSAAQSAENSKQAAAVSAASADRSAQTANQLVERYGAIVPATASADNKLVDEAFVNSSIQTATAHFRGSWATWGAVPQNVDNYPADDDGVKTPTTNDYLVVQDAVGYGAAYDGTWRFKYTGSWATDGKSGWKPEYQVNETPLTAAQLAALNSGITVQGVADIAGAQSTADSAFNLAETAHNLADEANGVAYNAIHEIETIERKIPAAASASNQLADKAWVNNAVANIPTGGANNVETFTYVVDSDQKLLDWANHVSGNDYTSVLIKKGEWHISRYIPLVKNYTSGDVATLAEALDGFTYKIVGEAESYIVFDNSESAGIYLPTGSSAAGFNALRDGVLYGKIPFSITGVTIKAPYFGNNGTEALESDESGLFHGLVHMNNCHVIIDNSAATTPSISASTVGTYYGFANCYWLSNCSFYYYDRKSVQPFRGFSACRYMDKCNAEIDVSGTGVNVAVYGFGACRCVSDCYVRLRAASSSATKNVGYYNCRRLTNCGHRGLLSASSLFGYTRCVQMSQCFTTGAVFDTTTCSASYGYAAEYAVADTPAGGFNVVSVSVE